MTLTFLDSDGYDVGKYVNSGQIILTATVQELSMIKWEVLERSNKILTFKSLVFDQNSLVGTIFHCAIRLDKNTVEHTNWFYILVKELDKKPFSGSSEIITYQAVPITRIHINGSSDPAKGYDEIDQKFLQS